MKPENRSLVLDFWRAVQMVDSRALVVRIRSDGPPKPGLGGGPGGFDRGPRPGLHDNDDSKLYVANLPQNVDEAALERIFAPFGQVSHRPIAMICKLLLQGRHWHLSPLRPGLSSPHCCQKAAWQSHISFGIDLRPIWRGPRFPHCYVFAACCRANPGIFALSASFLTASQPAANQTILLVLEAQRSTSDSKGWLAGGGNAYHL